MAKQKFTHFIPRDKPKKRPGVHKKTQNKMRAPDKVAHNIQGDIKINIDLS